MTAHKEVKALNVRVDATIFDRFTAYCKAKGQSKTVALNRILDSYLSEYEANPSSKADK